MENVSRYIEGQMNKSLDAANLEDAELLGLLGGSGGSQVDVVLYVTDRGKSIPYVYPMRSKVPPQPTSPKTLNLCASYHSSPTSCLY